MPSKSESPSGASTELAALLAEEWETHLREDPLFATLAGDRRYDDRLPSASEGDYERRASQLADFVRRAEAVDASALSHDDRLNRDIFLRLKRNALAEIGFHSYRMPMSRLGGFHTEFAELPNFMRFDTAQDYERYLARLEAFRGWVDQHIELMRAAAAQGYTQPRVCLEGTEGTMRSLLVDNAEASLFFGPFQKFPEPLRGAEGTRLAERGRAAIQGSVLPAFRTLLEFFEREYLPACRTTIAASALPNGAAYYQHRVQAMTTLAVSPEEVHRIGQEEVARIRAEMDHVIRKTGFEGDLAAFLQFLRTDPRFYASSADQLMREAAYILKRMDGELPRLFRRLPRTPYGILPVPDHMAPHTTTAYYWAPLGDGTRAGFYYVNTYDLPSRPLYEMEALSLHEAVPGHHLQIALQIELENIPNFRRFEDFTAFTEGWGLYAERLGLECGFYQDPYSDFGRLGYEIWRACRLVVDTGMHALGWTRQQAIDFMLANTPSTPLNIRNEIDRYIGSPAQALAYKMGELKIRELRRRAQERLGGRFDVRVFHEVVLRQGSIPLDVLEAEVEAWLKEQR
ncbi:MAG TPA: DUF885 domain-containing protein [Anaerolineales bacterium]|nr:DUF885 domain-containing protein [Anaerolineales bacterium]